LTQTLTHPKSCNANSQPRLPKRLQPHALDTIICSRRTTNHSPYRTPTCISSPTLTPSSLYTHRASRPRLCDTRSNLARHTAGPGPLPRSTDPSPSFPNRSSSDLNLALIYSNHPWTLSFLCKIRQQKNQSDAHPTVTVSPHTHILPMHSTSSVYLVPVPARSSITFCALDWES
jgi:hypothetical protein